MYSVPAEVTELLLLLKSILSDILDRDGYFDGEWFMFDLIDSEYGSDHPNFLWKPCNYGVVWYLHPGRGTFANMAPEAIDWQEFLDMTSYCVAEATAAAKIANMEP